MNLGFVEKSNQKRDKHQILPFVAFLVFFFALFRKNALSVPGFCKYYEGGV
jgi:hypothetical protein